MCVILRAGKLPYKNFDYNIRRAEALARLHSYLEDLLYREGKRTIQPIFKIPSEFGQALGIDKVMNRAMNRFVKDMKKEFEAEFEEKGKEHYEKIAKDYVRRLMPRLQYINRMFEDLGLLMDQTLLGQALIASVSAFEVYLRELTVSVIILNPSVRKKFQAEINSALSFHKLEGYKQDAKRVQGEIVAELVKLDTKRLKSFLKRLIGLENVFGDRKTEFRIRKIFETRHIMIHRAGLTDPKFKKATRFKGGVDKQIKIGQKYVLNSIGVLRDLSQKIETHIHPMQ